MHRKTRSKGRKTNRKQKGGGLWNSFKETIKRGVSKIFSSKETSTTGIAPVVPKPVVAPAPVALPKPNIVNVKQNNYGMAVNNGRRRNNYGMGAVAPAPRVNNYGMGRRNNYGMGAVAPAPALAPRVNNYRMGAVAPAPAPRVNNYRMGQNYNRRRNMNRMYAPGAPQQPIY